MKAKLIVEGKEFDIEIQDPELQKLVLPKKTGYERMYEDKIWFETDTGDHFWMYAGKCDENCDACSACNDQNRCIDYDENDNLYEAANYYSSEVVASNNARADKLMRQLRRFAVEHRSEQLRWNDNSQFKHYIAWVCGMSLGVHHCTTTREPGVVYFDSVKAAVDATNTFRDELIWYFTEYKDSL